MNTDPINEKNIKQSTNTKPTSIDKQNKISSEATSIFDESARVKKEITKSADVSGTKIPLGVDNQLDLVYHNALKKLENIPFPFSLMGKDKIKNETIKILDDENFRNDTRKILNEAISKDPNNANKNVIELVRDKDIYEKSFDIIKKYAKDSSLLSKIVNSKLLEDKLYKYINSDKAMSFLKKS